jgi:hypothetical protein
MEWEETYNHIPGWKLSLETSNLQTSGSSRPVCPCKGTGDLAGWTLYYNCRLSVSILQSRWSQDHQLVCFASRKNSPRCCNYLFPHCPTVSKSCERSGSGGGLATSTKPRGFALATEL